MKNLMATIKINLVVTDTEDKEKAILRLYRILDKIEKRSKEQGLRFGNIINVTLVKDTKKYR